MGRRVQKKVYSYDGGSADWSLTSIDSYLYDGWNMIEELDTAGAASVAYIWGLDLSQSLQGAGGVGGLLARVASGASYTYTFDGNGNVGQLIDGAGDISAHYEYDAYGSTARAIGTLSGINPYRFSTKYFDRETNLYYYGYRYYLPELGRWVNRDPIGEEGGVNLYGMVGNDPDNWVDLLGLKDNWHHLYPQQFKPNFDSAGIDIDSSSGGWVLDNDFHTGKGGLHPSWNKAWDEFFKQYPDASKQQIQNQLSKMFEDAQFSSLLAKGRPATMNFQEWKCWLRRASHELKGGGVKLRGLGVIGAAATILDAVDTKKRADEAGKDIWQQAIEDILGIDLSDPCIRGKCT
jgi:RHS repeat-associated protein